MLFVGYLARAISSQNKDQLLLFISQSSSLLLAPVLLNASVYMCFGRVIDILPNGTQYALIRTNWQTKIFVTCDVLSYLLESTGALLIATSQGDADKIKIGDRLNLVGLFAGFTSFGAFVSVMMLFWWRYHRNENQFALDQREDCPWKGWRMLMKCIFIGSGLMVIKAVFKIAEYIQGSEGQLLGNEMWLYVFDAALTLQVLVLFGWKFPGLVVKGRRRSKEEGESVGSGHELGNNATAERC